MQGKKECASLDLMPSQTKCWRKGFTSQTLRLAGKFSKLFHLLIFFSPREGKTFAEISCRNQVAKSRACNQNPRLPGLCFTIFHFLIFLQECAWLDQLKAAKQRKWWKTGPASNSVPRNAPVYAFRAHRKVFLKPYHRYQIKSWLIKKFFPRLIDLWRLELESVGCSIFLKSSTFVCCAYRKDSLPDFESIALETPFPVPQDQYHARLFKQLYFDLTTQFKYLGYKTSFLCPGRVDQALIGVLPPRPHRLRAPSARHVWRGYD